MITRKISSEEAAEFRARAAAWRDALRHMIIIPLDVAIEVLEAAAHDDDENDENDEES